MNSLKKYSISIEGRRIALDAPPYIIAELSANHNGDINNAIKIVTEAKRVGADAVKLQTYSPETITLNCSSDEFQIKGGLWGGKTLHQLYTEAYMPWEWHKMLFEHARKCGITIFSSPFDSTAVDLLEDLNAPAYKVASFEMVDLPLIRYIAGTGKPIIISTGMANVEEIEEAIETARSGGCRELAVLRCVSGYPAPPQDYNLRTLSDMADRFGLVTGLSDHTIGNATAIASIALGASIIEKHFTLDRKRGGPDDSFSIEPIEFQRLCNDANAAWSALGCVSYGSKSSEMENVMFRRSLYFVKSLKCGDIITEDSVKSVRPGFGLAPKFLPEILGKRVARDVEYGTSVTKDKIQ
jgi:N-acetylneuraminate synthase